MCKKEDKMNPLKTKLQECFPGDEYYDLIDGLARAVFCLEHGAHFAGFYGDEGKAVDKFFKLCSYEGDDT